MLQMKGYFCQRKGKKNLKDEEKGFLNKNIPFCGGSNRKQRSKRIIGSTFPCFY